MAAHDENISQNRRKLFKALSAAPVVATLAPGEAAATASAFQCLQKDTPNLILTNANQCNEGDCFASEAAPQWLLESPPANPVPGSPVKTCAAGHPLVGKTVIRAPANGGGFIFIEPVGTTGWNVLNQDYFAFTAPDVISVRDIPDPAGTNFCWENLAALAAPAYITIKSTVDDNAAPTDWSLVDRAPVTAQPGLMDLRGITATCMVSVHPDVTGFIFVKG